MCTVGHIRTNEHDPVLKHVYPQSDQPFTPTIQILLLPPRASNNKSDLISNTTEGRDSVVSIATRYRLDGSGLEPWWGQEILSSHPSRLTPQHTEPAVKRAAGLFLGVKWPRRDVDHPPSSTAEVKEGVKLYLYSPSVFKAFYRETLYLSFYQISQLSQYTAA